MNGLLLAWKTETINNLEYMACNCLYDWVSVISWEDYSHDIFCVEGFPLQRPNIEDLFFVMVSFA